MDYLQVTKVNGSRLAVLNVKCLIIKLQNQIFNDDYSFNCMCQQFIKFYLEKWQYAPYLKNLKIFTFHVNKQYQLFLNVINIHFFRFYFKYPTKHFYFVKHQL